MTTPKIPASDRLLRVRKKRQIALAWEMNDVCLRTNTKTWLELWCVYGHSAKTCPIQLWCPCDTWKDWVHRIDNLCGALNTYLHHGTEQFDGLSEVRTSLVALRLQLDYNCIGKFFTLSLRNVSKNVRYRNYEYIHSLYLAEALKWERRDDSE